MRGARGLLITAGTSVTILLGACHKEVQSSGALPVDTAAVMPMLDTTPAPDSASLADSSADSTGADSASASLLPAEPSVIAIADSAAGDRLFHAKGRCFTCHGERGQGTPRLGSSLTDSEWLSGNGSLAAIRDVIAHGVAVSKASSVAMPAYSAMLSEQEIALTASYVYALAHPGSTHPDSARADSGARDTSGHALPNGAR
ncbi:MAG TPA: c-type cytochrome [Gemmatimonadaceae bacterium]